MTFAGNVPLFVKRSRLRTDAERNAEGRKARRATAGAEKT